MIGDYERIVLVSICKATSGSKSAHVPRQYFMKKFQENNVYPHPTSGETTYQMTEAGWRICREMKEALR